jgi:quercetin dioxygenase-like cupin family protein
MEATGVSVPTVLTSDEIAGVPHVRLGNDDAVTHQVLWRTDDAMAGLLTIPSGHRLGEHQHRVNHHHMWVIEGSAEILGVTVGPGSYVHVPSEVGHDIDATATSGVTVFYIYEPTSG